MVTTQDDAAAERMRIMSLHGISKDAWKRYSSEGSWYYEILAPGFKYNLTDIAASIGRAQLRKSPAFLEARRRIARCYDEAFGDMPEVVPPACRPNVEHAWHLYFLRIRPHKLGLSRNAFIEALKAERIGASVHFIPLHLHPYYRTAFGYRPEDFPVASRAFERVVSLPIYPRMTDRDVQDVIDAVWRIVNANRVVSPVSRRAAAAS